MGKSRSKSTQNSTNTSGSNAINGDNLGVAVSGVNNSNVNVTMTDHGAMEAATELGELALTSNTEVSKAALESNEKVSKHAIDSSLDFGRDALDSNNKALNSAFAFGSEALQYSNEISAKAIDEVSLAHGENLQMLAGLAGNQAQQNSENLQAIKELAEVNADGGQIATTKQMTITVGLVLGFLGLLTLKG